MGPEKKKAFDPREMPRVRVSGDPAGTDGTEIAAGGRRVLLLPLGRAPRPVVWVHMPAEAARETAKRLTGKNLVLAAVTDADWERDLSPWPAPRAFKGGREFSGGADDYLAALTEKIVPEAETALAEPPLWRGIAGYSLAGLFAAYAAWKTALFSRFASVSGSLWYDGFLEYLGAGAPVLVPERAYFSLGDLEKNTRNQRLARVEDCTAQAAARFAALGSETNFEHNAGGHFVDAEMRAARGIEWLTQ